MINNIAFSGGGMKGLAYVGVLKLLEEKDLVKDLKKFSGTSVGALFSLMVILGYNHEEITNLALNIDLYKLEDLNIEHLFTNYGLNRGEKITRFLKYLIKFKGYDEDISFKQLYDITKKELYITVCLLNNCSTKVFNHLDTPDYKIYQACKYSMRIPLLWGIEEGEDPEKQYIDGCFSANLPIEIFEPENTLGVATFSENISSTPSDIKQYIVKIVKCMLNKNNSLEHEKYTAKGYSILNINIRSFSALELDSSSSTKRHIIDLGYDACCSYLKNIC